MIADLKPYPEYKHSGLTWLGHVPVHWRTISNGNLFAQRNQTGYGDLPILEVSLKTGVRLRDFANSTRKQVMSDLGKYKRALKGDLAYNMMRMWQGALGVCPVDGLVSPAYVVARPYPEVDSRFFAILFRTGVYMAEVDNCSHGIVKDRNRLYWDQFKQILSPCPTPREQEAIVRFLNWANGRLERTILAKRKVNGLLTEQKQAIIHRAVTRGLDPSAPLKPSGIPWLGDIPQHWEVKPLKRLIQNGTTISYGIVQPGDHVEEGVPFLQTTNISKPSLHTQSLQRTTAAIAAAYPRTQLKARDVVVGIRASIGAAHIVPQELAGVNLSRGIARIVPNAEVTSEYLVQFLRSSATSRYWEYARQGTTFNEVAISAVRVLPVVLPPVPEQTKIVTLTREMCAPADTTIERLEREMELLREYRTRLVADVVTGKLDVREAAARLPEDAAPDIDEQPDELTDEVEPSDEEAVV